MVQTIYTSINMRSTSCFVLIGIWFFWLPAQTNGLSEIDKKCSAFECPEKPDSPQCPEDSSTEFKPVSIIQPDLLELCCAKSYCSCNKCLEKPKCELGEVLIELSQGNGKPGSCCTEYQCGMEPKCVRGMGITYWRDECTKCNSCHPLCQSFCQSDSALSNCLTDDKQIVMNGEQWSQGDGCEHCTCKNGIIECETYSCKQPECEQYIKVPGVCCPVCLNTESVTTEAAIVPSSSTIKSTAQISSESIENSTEPFKQAEDYDINKQTPFNVKGMTTEKILDHDQVFAELSSTPKSSSSSISSSTRSSTSSSASSSTSSSTPSSTDSSTPSSTDNSTPSTTSSSTSSTSSSTTSSSTSSTTSSSIPSTTPSSTSNNSPSSTSNSTSSSMPSSTTDELDKYSTELTELPQVGVDNNEGAKEHISAWDDFSTEPSVIVESASETKDWLTDDTTNSQELESIEETTEATDVVEPERKDDSLEYTTLADIDSTGSSSSSSAGVSTTQHPSSLATSAPNALTPESTSWHHGSAIDDADYRFALENHNDALYSSNEKYVWIMSIGAFAVFLVLVLFIYYCVKKCKERKSLYSSVPNSDSNLSENTTTSDLVLRIDQPLQHNIEKQKQLKETAE